MAEPIKENAAKANVQAHRPAITPIAFVPGVSFSGDPGNHSTNRISPTDLEYGRISPNEHRCNTYQADKATPHGMSYRLGSMVGDWIGGSRALRDARGLGSRCILRPRDSGGQSGEPEEEPSAVDSERPFRNLSSFHVNLHVKFIHGVVGHRARA
jgi:hypothetical protein